MKTNLTIKIVAVIILASLLCFVIASCGNKAADPDTTSAVLTDAPETERGSDSETEEDTASDALKSEDVLDENGKLTGRNYYNEEGYLISREIYDEAGRTVEYTTFNPSGDVSTSMKYTYLSGNEIINYTFEIYEYEKGALTQLVTRRYDGDDLLLSVLVTDGAGERVESYAYEYDDAGRMIEEVRADSKNVRTSVTEYEYGEDGYVSRTTYRTGSGKLSSYTEYDRDSDGKALKDYNYDADGNMTSYVEYVYDDNGEVAETHEYMPDEDGEFVEIG